MSVTRAHYIALHQSAVFRPCLDVSPWVCTCVAQNWVLESKFFEFLNLGATHPNCLIPGIKPTPNYVKIRQAQNDTCVWEIVTLKNLQNSYRHVLFWSKIRFFAIWARSLAAFSNVETELNRFLGQKNINKDYSYVFCLLSIIRSPGKPRFWAIPLCYVGNNEW